MEFTDAKEVASNAALSKQFSVAVYNIFEALSANTDLKLNNIEEVYSNLVSATESVAKEMLPKKQWANSPDIQITHLWN